MNGLIRYTTSLTSLQREVDRLFEQVLGTDFAEERVSSWTPRTDISETDDRYIIRMDTPGLTKNDVTVQLHDGMLSVSGERKFENEEKKENYHRLERSWGHFYRSFPLPQAGDADRVTASMANGVLTIEVMKREESKPRKIKIS